MQGTSMAAPLVAGAAALVRQYFQDGMYPSGAPISSNSFNPSGPLVKAVLIAGAAGLSGYEPDTGLPLAPPPSFRQGYGRLQLSNSLPLQVCIAGHPANPFHKQGRNLHNLFSHISNFQTRPDQRK